MAAPGLTCAGAEGEAQPPLGAVEDHVEAFHHRGSDHQPVDRRGHPEAEAVQRAVQVGDLLDVELRADGTGWRQEAGGGGGGERRDAVPAAGW